MDQFLNATISYVQSFQGSFALLWILITLIISLITQHHIRNFFIGCGLLALLKTAPTLLSQLGLG